jgi:hypothetical protein
MIRIPVTIRELEQRVDAVQATWRNSAANRTAHFRAVGRYDEASGQAIWGDIKAVYMALQYNKCAYCETLLEGPPYGRIVHDIEHYRPKNSVKRWPTPSIRKKQNITYRFQTGSAWGDGYYLLAYHLLNYATACKPCNSTLKRDYFPIYGPQRVLSDTLANYRAEDPLLIYPFSDVDDDPEELITFEGIIAVPKKTSGLPNYRARVTIDFFDLNGRDFLRRSRAFQIKLLWDQLSISQHGPDPARRQEAHEFIHILLSPRSPIQIAHVLFTRCAKLIHSGRRHITLRPGISSSS